MEDQNIRDRKVAMSATLNLAYGKTFSKNVHICNLLKKIK